VLPTLTHQKREQLTRPEVSVNYIIRAAASYRLHARTRLEYANPSIYTEHATFAMKVWIRTGAVVPVRL
jgi:hypothetical protein